jgi:hypothetical protein
MRYSYYQDAREEEGRLADRWASVRLSRLFLSLETLSSVGNTTRVVRQGYKLDTWVDYCRWVGI